MEKPTPTPSQLEVLAYAARRPMRDEWAADRLVAEQCFLLGWLELSLRPGADVKRLDSVVYVITPQGSAVLLGSAR